MLRTNGRQFDAEIRAEVHALGEQHRQLTLLAASTYLHVAVPLCAVDTGQLRNNFVVGVSPVSQPRKLLGGNEGDPPDGRQVAQLVAAEAALQPFGSLFVSNPVEYFSYVDGGTDKMPARPMHDPAMEAVGRLVK